MASQNHPGTIPFWRLLSLQDCSVIRASQNRPGAIPFLGLVSLQDCGAIRASQNRPGAILFLRLVSLQYCGAVRASQNRPGSILFSGGGVKLFKIDWLKGATDSLGEKEALAELNGNNKL